MRIKSLEDKAPPPPPRHPTGRKGEGGGGGGQQNPTTPPPPPAPPRGGIGGGGGGGWTSNRIHLMHILWEATGMAGSQSSRVNAFNTQRCCSVALSRIRCLRGTRGT